MALIGDTTGLDEFVYAGKPILPEQDSYQLKIPGGVVRSDIAGGLPKSQLQFYNFPYEVTGQYRGLDGFKIAYIENFLDQHRGQKFIAYLLISSGDIEPFIVQYRGDPQVSKTGFNGSTSITFEVEPAIDRCYQKFILDWGACLSGGDITSIATNVNEAVKVWP